MDAEDGVQAGRKITTAADAQAAPVAWSCELLCAGPAEKSGMGESESMPKGADARDGWKGGSVVKEGERDGGGGGGQGMEGQGREAEEK